MRSLQATGWDTALRQSSECRASNLPEEQGLSSSMFQDVVDSALSRVVGRGGKDLGEPMTGLRATDLQGGLNPFLALFKEGRG